jgi:Zn-dependent protease
MSAILGSEWCHNLAHAAAARLVGKPVDAIRINLGMPLLVYYDIEDPTVTPRQHVCRALGGPLINLYLLVVSVFFRGFTRPGTMARDIIDAVRGMNLFLVIAGLQPQPWLDGGVMLKWSLVAKGHTLEDAERKVRQANGAAAAGLGIAAAVAFNGYGVFKKNRKRWGWLFGLLAALSLATATGFLKEKA